MKNEVIDTRAARIWIDDDSILHFEILPEADVILADAQENIAICARLKRTERACLMIDLRAIKSITREARTYFAGNEAGELAEACAILIGSAGSRVIGNFFLGLNKPTFPTRLFSSEDKALAWLKEFPAKKETRERK